MGEEFIVNLLSNIGVPAAVCFYTLFGVNKTLKELTAAINKQTAEFDRRAVEQSQKIDRLEHQVHELTFKVENLTRKE